MDRTTKALLADFAIGCAAGLVAMTVYGLVQGALYRPMPRDVKRREGRGEEGRFALVPLRKWLRAGWPKVWATLLMSTSASWPAVPFTGVSARRGARYTASYGDTAACSLSRPARSREPPCR